ncbi:MAG: zinc ribbon domain-containing protein [Dysosmobacter sp.]
MSRYSGKYALSGLLFCGECGTAYRRVVWTQHGEKQSRVALQQPLGLWKEILQRISDAGRIAASAGGAEQPINASMSGCKVLADQLVDAMEQELAPIPGESMSLGDIDRAVTELEQTIRYASGRSGKW